MNWFSWDNLNRKPSIFPWNSWGFPVNCPLNQSIEHSGGIHKKHCFKGGSDREQKSTLNEWSLRNHWQFKSSQLSIQCRRLLNLLSLKPRDRGQLFFFGTIQWINLKFQTLPTSENPLPGLWWLLACQWWSTATLQHLSGRGRPFQHPTGMWGDAWWCKTMELPSVFPWSKPNICEHHAHIFFLSGFVPSFATRPIPCSWSQAAGEME
jgi:hypothetical protein